MQYLACQRIVVAALAAFGSVAASGCGADGVECGVGTVEDGGACVPAVTCGDGTVEDNGQCVPDDSICGPGTSLVGGACVVEVTPRTATEWIDSVDWGGAELLMIEMGEGPGVYGYFPDNLSVTVGQPYVLEIQNPMTNTGAHHFFAPEFLRAVAIRKLRTEDAEYRAPYFHDIELLDPSAATTRIYLEFVPVVAGEYSFLCPDADHAALGMTGVITIGANEAFASPTLDQEISEEWIGPDARASDSHPLWASPNTDYTAGGAIETQEIATDYAFDPTNIALTVDTAYRLQFDNPTGNAARHFYVAKEFFKKSVWNGVTDSAATLRLPYLDDISLGPDGSATLSLVPSVPGIFGASCTVPGHAAGGMVGTVQVSN